MIDLLKSIVEFIKTIAGYVIHTVESILNLLAAIPRFITYLTTLINYLVPDILKPFLLLALISIFVLFIVNRRK